MKREPNEYDENCDSPVKITVGGTEWYYQTFYGEDGEVNAVRLYDSSGEFAREYKSLGSLTGALKQIVKFRKKKDEEEAKEVREKSFRPRNIVRGISREEMEKVKRTIVERLGELRGEKTLSAFADQVELSVVTIQHYVVGSSVPSVYALKRISEKCGVTIDWLLGGD